MRLRVELADEDLAAEQLDEATGTVYRQLRDLDVLTVERPGGGPVPEGARGEALAIATLVVTLADSRALAAVVQTVRGWLGARPARRARLRLGDDELEVSGLSPAEQQELVRAWLERQTRH